ncbi:peptide-methionine (R)-S-oxide reductase MsrB [Hymenobacter sp. BT175]|uniref:peptide-methionine (R)-S-oxide reductase MsrB n=1 Tax=Hymenobacter translucens TaxID=2886507 RepID=UPI001D0DDC40|nr:peptide-methionine (R)-S-oxide reductase MsrB [Hymenobacter translucens]MCC2548220.1 peptide-methionine (R)-S-oxide reductase MsrB [Hymenobacter translucens]
MLRWSDVVRFAKYGNPEPPRRVELSEAEWERRLAPARFRVLRQKATESPYRNAYCRSYEPGTYACAGCGSLLFGAEAKYHAISGWPSFTGPLARNAVRYAFDDSHHLERIEALCNVCDGHLGHVFPDGPAPAGLRFCINSESLIRTDPEAPTI